MESEFWKKICERNLEYKDYEKFIYNNHYLKNCHSNESIYEYNKSFNTYFFSAKAFTLYDTVFFQSMIDGDIEKDTYLHYERNIFNFVSLFNKNDCYTYFFGDRLNDIEVYKEFESGIESERFFDKNLNERIIKLDGYFNDFLLLLLREVYNCDLIFSKSKIIIQLSGLHGILISEKKFKKNEIVSFLQYLEEFEEYSELEDTEQLC